MHRPIESSVKGAIAFLRDNWRNNDGAEGESVKLVCNELEIERGASLEIARFHKLLLDRTGATQFESIDVIMGRWLDQLAEIEAHHREHHNCTDCKPCGIYREHI